MLLLVALGAAMGAPLRYAVGILVDRSASVGDRPAFPWGTFTVNVAGSLVLGVLVGGAHRVSGPVGALLGTGLCGALTTYSTFGLETVRLGAGGALGRAVLYAATSVTTALAAATVGIAVARLIW
jgi:CrcB protein